MGAVLSLVYLAIVTRTLGMEGFGQFTLVLSTAQAVSIIVNFETWQIVVKFGQRHMSEARHDRLGRLFRLCMLVDAGGALCGCLLAGAIIMVFAPHFGWSDHLSLSAFLFCTAMLLSIRSTPMGILRLFNRFDAGALAETVVPVARLTGAVIVLAFGPSIPGFLIAWAIAEWLCATAYWGLALRASRAAGGRWSKGNVRLAAQENDGIFAFLTATNLGTTFASATKQLSVLIIGFFIGPASAGLYRLANQLSTAMLKVSDLMSRAAFAELTRANGKQSGESMRRLFRRINLLALGGGIMVVVLILLIGKPVLLLVAGPAFGGAYPLLLLLGIAASIDFGGFSFRPLLMATDGAKTALTIIIIVACLQLCLLPVLLPRFGAQGAAWASVTTSSVGFLLMGWASLKNIRRAR